MLLFQPGHSTIRSIVDVCRRTIDNYINDSLPYAQPRKIRYINREDLDAWVEEHRVQDEGS